MPSFSFKDVTETPYLYVTKSCSMDPKDISAAMEEAYDEVWGWMQKEGVEAAGRPLAVYHSYDPNKMTFRAGFVVTPEDMEKADGAVSADVTPAGRVLHYVHKGPYATLRDDYALLMDYAESEGIEIDAPSWEIYVNDPAEVSEDELLTEAYISVA